LGQDKYLKIFFDGGSRGNPGPSAIGAVIYDEKGERIGELSEYIGKNTNNVAEYKALEKVLEYVEKLEIRKIILLTDSALVHNQIKKIWKIKDKKILDIYLGITDKLSQYEKVDLRLIPREKNREADKLVNRALDGMEFRYAGESGISFGEIED
jgi:ribonuclease HI